MASSPSIQTCLTIRHENYKCNSSIPLHHEPESENDMRKSKLRLNRGHALLRKQFNRSIVLHHHPKACKRRFTFPGNQEHKVLCKKRRRFTSVALPTKFLLGGNITDPLNLRSLEDEKVNQQLNAFTPASSPMPLSRHRTQVQVLIPPNIYDPLNLNTGEEIEFNLLTSKPRKRRRHRKSRREENENTVAPLNVVSAKTECVESSVGPENSHCHYDNCVVNDLTLEKPPSPSEDRVVSNKIVSPVVPQGSPAKFFKRYHSRSFSKDNDDKQQHKQVTKRRRSKTRLQQKADYVKYRANAEKFCYGNHVIRHLGWDGHDGMDQRLRILNENLFCGKDIMDVGCNSGELTLYIARHWKPRKIIGIDIDKKLINVAQTKLRKYKSEKVTEGINFPEAMSTTYGPLVKLGINMDSTSAFPNNVAFFEVSTSHLVYYKI